MTDWLNRTHVGDCRELMRAMAAEGVKVQTIVTSPPYWQLRNYGVDGAIGLEPSLQEWVDALVEVFAAAHSVLADNGVLWLNLGDSYNSSPGKRKPTDKVGAKQLTNAGSNQLGSPHAKGLKSKDLIGQPWRIAFALQEAGWYLRSEVIWEKLNPMPESVRDRPTKSHEQIFMLTKRPRYYYDAAAIAEPSSPNSHARASRARFNGYHPPGQDPHQGARNNGVGFGHGYDAEPKPRTKVHSKVAGWKEGPGSHSAKDHARADQGLRDSTKFGRGAGWRNKQNESFSAAVAGPVETRNVRTVWTFPTSPQPEAHFATFPPELVERCVLASTRPCDVVLDPFMGSGTTARVALSLGRQFIGCELSKEYVAIQDKIGLQSGLAL